MVWFSEQPRSAAGAGEQQCPGGASAAEALLFTAIITMRLQAALEAPLAAAEVPLVYLPGPQPHHVSPLDFDHTDMLVADAYEAAQTFLASLHVDGPGLYGSPSGQAAPPAVS